MGILKRLSNLLNPHHPPGHSDPLGYWVTVRCSRCGELIHTRVNLSNDLSLSDEDGKPSYYCHKTMMGAAGCFQRVEVELTFDAQRRLLDRQITGGVFVEKSPDLEADHP